MLFAIFPSSCGTHEAKDPFAYAKERFSVKISGEIDGVEISSNAVFNPTAAEDEVLISAEFLSPPSLSGITVNLYGDGSTGIRLGEISLKNGSFYSMVEPFLLLLPNEDYSSIQKNREGKTVIMFSSGQRELTYTFDDSCVCPQKICGRQGNRAVSLEISDFSAQ